MTHVDSMRDTVGVAPPPTPKCPHPQASPPSGVRPHLAGDAAARAGVEALQLVRPHPGGGARGQQHGDVAQLELQALQAEGVLRGRGREVAREGGKEGPCCVMLLL